MRSLDVEATDETDSAPSFQFAKNRTDKTLYDKSGLPLQRESGMFKPGKVKILKGE